MKRIGESFLRGIGAAVIVFVIVAIARQDVNYAVGPGLIAFVIFFFYSLFTGKNAATDSLVDPKTNKKEVSNNQTDDHFENLRFYEIAAEEVENGAVHKGTWAMASAKVGSTAKDDVIPVYLKLRSKQLADKLSVSID